MSVGVPFGRRGGGRPTPTSHSGPTRPGFAGSAVVTAH